jgi:group I intron endonuclease
MVRKHHVYVVTHRATGRHYVGKTSVRPERRWKHHINDALGGRHHCRLFHRALVKYGPDAFDWQVVESFDSEADALYFESWWIEFLRSTVREYGFNIFRDGVGGTLHEVSDETRAKLRAANLGKKYSEETRRKLSDMRRGKPHGPHTEATKKLISDKARARVAAGWEPANKGKQMPASARANMRRPHRSPSDERRKQISEQNVALWADPEYRARMTVKRSESMRQRWQDDEKREQMAEQSRRNGRLVSKLSDQDVIEIRALSARGDTRETIAAKYGISVSWVGSIVRGKKRTHVA